MITIGMSVLQQKKLGFAMPMPLIFADTNWVPDEFAFIVRALCRDRLNAHLDLFMAQRESLILLPEYLIITRAIRLGTYE